MIPINNCYQFNIGFRYTVPSIDEYEEVLCINQYLWVFRDWCVVTFHEKMSQEKFFQLFSQNHLTKPQ